MRVPAREAKKPVPAADPFHLASTPVALLPHLGLRTRVGLSGEDPSGRRHHGLDFEVWTTLYDPTGLKVERRRHGSLRAGERRSLDLSDLAARFGYSEPHLCVVHRVPRGARESDDFDMYRTVVQYEHPRGGRGSVIYETPPRFNARSGGSFLSFTNQVVVGGGMQTHLLLLHYSVSDDYRGDAPRRLVLLAPDGRRLRVEDGRVRPFTADVVDLGRLLGESAAPQPVQRSLVACSRSASMIPLLLNLHESTGGVSVEHTHPPAAYLGLPPAEAARVRADAVAHYQGLA